jgi:transcription antitermination factor NusA-like protein
MNQDQKEPIVRLIVDNEQKSIGAAIGISEQRVREIEEEIAKLTDDREHKTVSRRMQIIAETYHHPAEFVYAIFVLGEMTTKANCPLHRGKGGILGLFLGSFPPPPDDKD